MLNSAIYVHVPFCAKKCAYCDFESHAGMLQYADEYINNVIEEAVLAKSEYGDIFVPTVYIGGGTPSILSPKQIHRLISGVLSNYTISYKAEITMEANPGTLNIDKLNAARDAGVNRLSIGAQSANDTELKMLGRIHTWADVVNAVELARSAGFDNISLDLMYALPKQKLEDLCFSIKRLLELNPEHISCYSLICEDGTPLTNRIHSGELNECSDDTAADMQALIIDELQKHGYHRYEISNYAKIGRESEHNKAYWQRKNYIGLGCAAHSMVNDVRYANPDFEGYMRGERNVDKQTLTKNDILEETIMLSTRTALGIEIAEFKNHFGEKALLALIEEAEKLQNNGLVRLKESRLFLTDRGFDVQNAIVLRLVTHLEEAH